MMLWAVVVLAFLSIESCIGLDKKCSQEGERCKLPFSFDGKASTECVSLDGSSRLVCPVKFYASGSISIKPCVQCAGDPLCYIKAELGIPFTIDCPSSCSRVTRRLWGGPSYTIDSHVCAAAIHAGTIEASTGGSANVRLLPSSFLRFRGSSKNGVISKTRTVTVKGFQPTATLLDRPPTIIYSEPSKVLIKDSIRRYESLTLKSGFENIIALDVDIRRRVVYLSDSVQHNVYRATLRGTSLLTDPVIVHDESKINLPEGIAIDWLHENLYCIDVGLPGILVSKPSGTHLKTLIKREQDYLPRAIALDPISGYMYISDWGDSPKIERCFMSEDNCVAIVTQNVTWPNGLAFDMQEQRLYWVDGKYQTISSCRNDGSDRRNLVTSKKYINHPFGLAISQNRVFWTDHGKLRLQSVDKASGVNLHLLAAGLERPFGVVTLDLEQQPFPTSRCLHNTCHHLCLAAPGGFRCECPNGLVPLIADRSRCVNETENSSLLNLITFDDSNVTQLMYDPSGRSYTKSVLAASQNDPRSVVLDPRNFYVYWSNIAERVINRKPVLKDVEEGTEVETLMQGSRFSTFLRQANGLAVDWLHGNLFWTDGQLNSVYFIDIARSITLSLNRRHYIRVISRSSAYHPQAIALDPENGFMYISDTGDQPKIEKCWMNGESCTSVVENNIALPYGVAVDSGSGKLYWSDGLLKTISFCNTDGTDRRTLISLGENAEPYGVVVHLNSVYWADRQLGTINKAEKAFGVNFETIISGLRRPTGLDILARHGHILPTQRKCSRDVCRYSCVPLPQTSGRNHACVCPLFQPYFDECRTPLISGNQIFDCGNGMQLSSNLSRCEDANECLSGSHTCEQICENTLGSFRCSCNEGFSLTTDGRSCELQVNACTGQPCRNGGTCTVLESAPGFLCDCAQGFRGQTCDQVYALIQISHKPIRTGELFILECRAPLTVEHVIIWRLNRKEIVEEKSQINTLENGRKLMVFHSSYLFAGEYHCQFLLDGIEYSATTFVTVETPPSLICGKAIGINSGIRQKQPRIFGGTVTAPLGAPFMAMLYKTTPDPTYVKPGLFCGASLIDSRHVVTAAHCVLFLTQSEIRIYVGKLSADVNVIEPYQQSANVSAIFTYPDFDPDSLHADYAILRVDAAFTFTEGVKPICIPLPNDNNRDLKPRPPKDKNAVKFGMVFGWGFISQQQTSRSLREVKLPIRRQEYCNSVHERITSLMFCAGGGTTQDACHGDSGGPFALWSSELEIWSLAGIVSWGDGCGNPERPGVYARVGASIRQWIYDNSAL